MALTKAHNRMIEGTPISVKDFGATGDGVTSDQDAINLAIDYVNGISGTNRVSLLFPAGVYIITGGANINTVGDYIAGAVVEGIKKITRSNVSIYCEGSELKVSSSFIWRRTQIGGGDQDNFAQGLHFHGDNIYLYDGILNGNLRNRTITRGPTANNYGGNEYGILVRSNGCRVYNTISREWGTDCLGVIKADFQAFQSEFIAGRRLSCSVVIDEDATEVNPIIFKDCIFSEGGAYSDVDYNRPASGIDIEANSAGLEAVVICDSCIFKDNRKYAVQISQSAVRNVFTNCDFYGDVSDFTTSLSLTLEVIFQAFNLQPSNSGDHKITNNRFHGDQYLDTVYGQNADPGSVLSGNYFEDAATLLNMRTSTDFPKDWRITNNVAPNATEIGTLRGVGHISDNNVLIDPLNYSFDVNVAISGTETFDFETVLPCENVTYEVICKSNNGSGAYDASARYIMTFVGGTLEGAITVDETSGSGSRTITRSGAVISFAGGTFGASAGLIAKAIGIGDFGT